MKTSNHTTKYNPQHIRRSGWLLVVLLMMVAAGCVSCSEEGEETHPETTGRWEIRVPVSVALGQGAFSYTRAPGDPGVDDELPAPTHLYVWCTVKDFNGTYQVFYRAINCTSADWTFTPDGTLDGEGNFTPDGGTIYDDNEMARYIKNEPVGFVSEVLVADGVVGRVFVVASCDDLGSQMDELNTELGVTANGADGVKQLGGYIDESAFEGLEACLKGWDVDLSGWCSTTDSVHSEALGNLYSTPYYKANAYGTADSEAGGNGVITFNGTTISTSTARLYHCAAKADFKWAVQAYDGEGQYDHQATMALQATTHVEGITINNLPTSVRIFDPTHNPTGTGTVRLLGNTAGDVVPLTPGNQWIGRAYCYVLQQPVAQHVPVPNTSAQLSYTVTFGVSAARPAHNGSLTPIAPDAVYTGWYRVNAGVER